MNGPGTIQMRHGVWRIRTARRGFPVRWEPFGRAWLVREILSVVGGFSPVMRELAQRLACKVVFSRFAGAAALATKALEGPASITSAEQVYLSDWRQWIGNVKMVANVRSA